MVTRKSLFKPALLITLIAAPIALAFAPAKADISYTLKTTIGDAGNGGGGFPMPRIRTAYSYKGNKSRMESTMSGGPFGDGGGTVIITDADADKLDTYDKSLKVYTEETLSASRPDPFGLAGGIGGFGGGRGGWRRGGGGQGAPAPESGTLTVHVDSVDKGADTVNGVSAHHWLVTLTESATGTVHANPNPTKLDIWTDSDTRPLSPALKTAIAGGSSSTSGKVKYIYTGDVDKLKDLATDVPVRIQFSAVMGRRQGGATRIVTIDRLDYSTDPLDDSLFSVPSGAQKVTTDEYAQKRREAMQNRFREMFPGGVPGGPPHFPLGNPPSDQGGAPMAPPTPGGGGPEGDGPPPPDAGGSDQ